MTTEANAAGVAAMGRRLSDRLRTGAPPNVALMHLLMEASSPATASLAMEAARKGPGAASAGLADALGAVADLWQTHPAAWEVVRATLAHAPHDAPSASPEAVLVRWEVAFDALARASPEAGVALYALGSPELLAAATGDVVAQLEAWGLLATAPDVLDLGCGIGRFALALAGRARSVLGLDLSAGMVAEARRRCADRPNVRFAKSNGRNLAPAATGAFDLVLAADVFPYLVEAGEGVAAAHVAEARRVLRPGGSLVVLNWSYRGDADADRRDVARCATATGFDVVRLGTRDLRSWDATAFHLRRASDAHSRSAG